MSSTLKTPVTLLQEYSVAKRLLPKYELILDGTGSHNPEFIYRVELDSLRAEGKGRSKQEAKHRAAEKMYKILQSSGRCSNDDEMLDCEDESMNDEFANYVGELKDYCISHYYPEPKYELEEEGGPSHRKIFKMKCYVSHRQSSGVGRTKRMAKRAAASKMLEHLKQLINEKTETTDGDTNSPPDTNQNKIFQKIPQNMLSDKEIFERFGAFNKNLPFHQIVMIKENPSAYYKDHHNAYVGLKIISPTVMKILDENFKFQPEDAYQILSDIAYEVGGKVNCVEIFSEGESDENYYVTCITVSPPLAGFGCNKTSSALDLLNSLIFFCKE